jgi:hypothetical protein
VVARDARHGWRAFGNSSRADAWIRMKVVPLHSHTEPLLMPKRRPVDDSEQPMATSPEPLDPLVPQLVDLLRRMPTDSRDEPSKPRMARTTRRGPTEPHGLSTPTSVVGLTDASPAPVRRTTASTASAVTATATPRAACCSTRAGNGTGAVAGLGATDAGSSAENSTDRGDAGLTRWPRLIVDRLRITGSDRARQLTLARGRPPRRPTGGPRG